MKTFNTKEELIEFLIKIAEHYAKKFGYARVADSESTHPLNAILGETKTLRWQGVNDKADNNGSEPERRHIEIRPRFGSWVIGIYLPKQRGYVSVEYGQLKGEEQIYQYSESQVFYEDGLKFMPQVLGWFSEKEEE